MAEVKPRSFDLKSWQGLTDVLRAARESQLDPHAYNEFRNLVLQYAQQKGSDPDLKNKIDTIINSFDHPHEDVVAEKPETPTAEENSVNPSPVRQHGRRPVPSFSAPVSPKTASVTPSVQPVLKPEEPAIPPSPQQETPPAVETETATPPEPVPVSVPKEVSPVQDLKSVEEYRTRIMEIKRRVNALVGNPITLIDHGNNVGREYMTALLNALKATSPGSVLNVDEAMANLEASFAKILSLGTGAKEVQKEPAIVSAQPVTESPEPDTKSEAEPELPPSNDADVPEAEPTQNIPEPEPPPREAEHVPDPEPEPEPEVLPEVLPNADVREEAVEGELTMPLREVEPEREDTRWSESGGDTNIQDQIKALREQLRTREEAIESRPPVQKQRPIIPSIVDIEESVDVPEPHVGPEAPQPQDELNTHALTHRPLSSMTGITLGTPQAELMTPEVTSVLTQMLHGWNIFAASGLFGMGPSGIEHPLYEKLSRLPMMEVLAGRFENADMKIVRAIKDYVNAWRHEQGIAYNQTETFEHYLRRVALRILKRQNGGKAV